MYTNHPSIILPFDPHLPWHRTAPWQNFRKNTAIGFHSQGQWSHIDEHDVFHLPFYPPGEEFLQTFQNSTANRIGNQKHTSCSKWWDEFYKDFLNTYIFKISFNDFVNHFTWTNWCVHNNMTWEQNHTEIWCNRRTGGKYLPWQALKIFLLWTHVQ